MWKISVNRSSLPQFGFEYDNIGKRYVYEIDPAGDGGGVYINNDEDFFRIDQYCFETLDGENDTYTPEHIAALEDDWRMERFVESGVAVYIACCPFCKNDIQEILGNGEGKYWVSCPKCLADGPVMDSEDDAIKAWNKR